MFIRGQHHREKHPYWPSKTSSGDQDSQVYSKLLKRTPQAKIRSLMRPWTTSTRMTSQRLCINQPMAYSMNPRQHPLRASASYLLHAFKSYLHNLQLRQIDPRRRCRLYLVTFSISLRTTLDQTPLFQLSQQVKQKMHRAQAIAIP